MATVANKSTYWSKTFLDEQMGKRLFDMDGGGLWPLLPNGVQQQQQQHGRQSDRAVLFVQMQLCEKTLRCWLDDRRVMSHFKNVQIFRQILMGVEYIHSQVWGPLHAILFCLQFHCKK